MSFFVAHDFSVEFGHSMLLLDKKVLVRTNIICPSYDGQLIVREIRKNSKKMHGICYCCPKLALLQKYL